MHRAVFVIDQKRRHPCNVVGANRGVVQNTFGTRTRRRKTTANRINRSSHHSADMADVDWHTRKTGDDFHTTGHGTQKSREANDRDAENSTAFFITSFARYRRVRQNEFSFEHLSQSRIHLMLVLYFFLLVASTCSYHL